LAGKPAGVPRFVRSNGLSLAMFGLAAMFIIGLSLAGARQHDEDQREHGKPAEGYADAPWPVRRGGLVLRICEHSLSTALLSLFALSLVLHAWGGARAYSEEQQDHGGEPVSVPTTSPPRGSGRRPSRNWQSEFFSIGVLLVLSIRLRDRGSPESKPVHASHAATGA